MSDFTRTSAPKRRKRQAPSPTSSLFFRGIGCGLPDHITKKDISQLFSNFESEVVRIVLFRDKSGKSQGKGFVEFESIEAASEALNSLHGTLLKDTIPISLNYSAKGGRSKPNEAQASAKGEQGTVHKPTSIPRRENSQDRHSSWAPRRENSQDWHSSCAPSFPRQLKTVVCEPFQCSFEHMLYLRNYFFVNHSKESEKFSAKLPAKLIDKNDSLSLHGYKDSITSSEQTIKDQLLIALHHEMVVLHYPLEYEGLLGEDFLMKINPDQDKVTCILQDKTTEADKKSSQKLTKEIYLFSRDPGCLQKATKEVKELQPFSKSYCLRPESQLAGNVKNCVELTAKKHLTKAVKTGKLSVRIHGFRVSDIEHTWKEIKTSIDNTVVSKRIPVSGYQLKYLQGRCLSYHDLQGEIEFPTLPRQASSPGDRPTHSITLKAKVYTINRVEDKIKKESCKCTCVFTQISCPKKHLQPWKKRWNKFVERQYTETKVHIEFDVGTPCFNEGSEECTVSFVLYGDNKSAISQAKDAIINEENGKVFTEQVVDLSQKEFDYIKKQADAVQSELEKSQQYICFQLVVGTKSNHVHLSVPSVLNVKQSQQLENFILSRVRNSVTRKFRFADVVAGLLFLSKHLLAVKESHRMVTFSHVDVPGPTLELVGLPTDVEDAERQIDKEIKKVSLLSISCDQLPLEKIHLPLLSSSQFSSFVSSLETKHTIACIYPTIEAQKLVLEQMHLQTSTGHIVTIQLEVSGAESFDGKTDAVITAVPCTSHLPSHSNKQEAREVITYQEELIKVNDLPSLFQTKEEEKVTPQPKSQIQVFLDRDKLDTPRAFTAALQVINRKRLGVISVRISLSDGLHKVKSHVKSLESIDTLGDPPKVKFQIRSQASPFSKEMSHDAIIRLRTAQVLYSVCTHSEVHPDTTIHTVRLTVPSNESAEVVADVFNSYSYTNGRKSTVGTSSVIEEPLHSSLPECDSSTSLSTQTSVGKWYWEDDSGLYYTEYDQDASDTISSAWTSDNLGKCSVLINQQHYVIDFAKMTQTNLLSGKERSIKHEVHTRQSTSLGASPLFATDEAELITEVQPVTWTYQDDEGRYCPYSAENSRTLEDMYQNRLPPCTLTVKRWTYSFDFDNMKQVNTKTNTERNIKRNVSSVVHSKSTSIVADNGLQILEKEQKVSFNIRGPKDSLPAARAEIKEKLDSLVVHKEISLPQQLTITKTFHDKVQSVLKDHKYISYRIEEPKATDTPSKMARSVIHIEGEKDLLLNAQTELQQELLNHTSEAASDVHCPEEWGSQTVTCELFDLERSSQKWLKLSKRFRKTMPNSTIKRIRRVQNKWLWEKYQRDKKRMHKKNNGKVNEKELFHGSRSTSADVIVHSEEGFDMRFSDKGMWGHANYFAEDASYSDSYAHKVGDIKEMFVAKVLTGDSFHCTPDRTLRMPPEKESTASGEVQLKQVRYDTVNGVTQHTKVYMTYSNDKAYPAYIIEYKYLPDLTSTTSGAKSGTNSSPSGRNTNKNPSSDKPKGGCKLM